MATKQVIVMRKDLNMRKGKMIAQGAHASMAFITKNFRDLDDQFTELHWKEVCFTDAEQEWLTSSFKKITVYVDSHTDLIEIWNQAKAADLECHLITDNGDTEFGGVPTNTCLAIGPDYDEKIDPITGHLPLL